MPRDGTPDAAVPIVAPPAGELAALLDALPDAVIVSAESSHKHEEDKEDVHFCEFGAKMLFRRLDLPTPINVDKVTASIDDGMVRIVAQKSENALYAESAAA